MPSNLSCPICGKPLVSGAPHGLCPACLLKAGIPTGTAAPRGSRTHFIPPSPAELARDFPQLEILELIGQGGMGAVYRARQPSLDRIVALKILPPQTAGDTGFAERFTREARALARLSHANIVGVHDFGQAGAFPYLVMEYVDGVNLRHLLTAGKIKAAEALAIVPRICEALQYAHDRGIVHRDIKPENILLGKNGEVKIADFGLAKLVGVDAANLSLTGERDVMGTPYYMAPEQVERPLEVDHRADIYSLGVVFYQMLTGELPLGRFAAPSRKVTIDVRLDEVVLRALEKSPEQRYQQANALKTEVETISARSRADPTGAPETHRGARGRVMIWVAAVAALVMVLLGGRYATEWFFREAPRWGFSAGLFNPQESSAVDQILVHGWLVELPEATELNAQNFDTALHGNLTGSTVTELMPATPIKAAGWKVLLFPARVGERDARVRVEADAAGTGYRYRINVDFNREPSDRSGNSAREKPVRAISTSASYVAVGEPIFLQLGGFAPGRKFVAVFRLQRPDATALPPTLASQAASPPPPPAATSAPRSAYNRPFFPTEFDMMESDPEILRERLRTAERQLELERARFDSGLSTSRLLLEAQREVARLKAKLADDRVGFAKQDYDLTRKRLEETAARRQAGLLTDKDVLAAESEFRIAEIRLRQEEARAASERPAVTGQSIPEVPDRR